MKRRLLYVAGLICLAGCVGPDPVQTRADRATFDAIAPEYRAYVEDDATLTEEQKARRFTTIETWENRIRAMEAETP
jgi:hypothetical protein